MADEEFGYKKLTLVESYYITVSSGKRGAVHIRPLPGQWCDTGLDASCSRKMVDTQQYPVGTVFKVLAHITNRKGGGEYLYVNPRDEIVMETPFD